MELVPKKLRVTQTYPIVGDDVRPTTAVPLFRIGGREAGFINRFGRGLALYFNFDPFTLRFVNAGKESPMPHETILERIFKARNIARGHEVEWNTGRPMVAGRPGNTLAEFNHGTGRYLALLRVGEGPLNEQPMEKATITLEKKAYVYRPRKMLFLGKIKKVNVAFARGTPCILALMPYRVRGIRLDAPQAHPGGNVRVHGSVITDGPAPGRHVFAFRVFGPDGTEATWFRKNLDVTRGACAYELPLALNAALGTWRITVRDVATGVGTEAKMNVTAPGSP